VGGNVTLYIVAGIILAVIAFICWLYLNGRSAGQSKVVADVATATVDTIKKQDKAAADAAAEDTVDRLRRGGF
jgi:predicted negative regulator of RcsB-dependent stress response